MPTASLCILILMALIGMIGFWGAYNFNVELRRSHLSEWERLGRPTAFSIKSAGQELRWIGFVIFRKYRKFRNPRLSRFGDVLFCCGLLALVLAVTFAFVPHRPGPVF
jgi:hypothetical protein